MIKVMSARIEEFRGIRKLEIDLNGKNFAISGPNGSGKSGVIDAIEFGLTGNIGRLSGAGTSGLTLADHGPHVEMTKFPDAALVELSVYLPSLKKSVKITRKVSAHRKPKIEPDEPDSWSVETGPLVESSADIWEDISKSLDKNKVETAAHTLRRHLEFEFGQLADGIGARIAFRSDGNYDLGELLPSTVGQLKTLYGRASEAFHSWNDRDGVAVVKERKDALKEANKYKGEEDWIVNRAIHYNEWANFGKNDFVPVVEAFKILLSCFQCEHCETHLEVTPRGQNANALRCQCSKVNLNLVKKNIQGQQK